MVMKLIGANQAAHEPIALQLCMSIILGDF